MLPGRSQSRTLDLVLLRVEVLLGAGHGAVLAQLEAAVDARRAARASRPAPARIRKAGGPAALEDLGQDVRRVGEEVAADVLGHPAWVSSVEVLGQLLLEVAPGEVGVGLA